MNRLLLVTVLALIAVGCGRPQRGDVPVIDVAGSLETFRQIPMSDYIEEIEYIPLETGRDCMIAILSKLIVTPTHIFTYDNRSNCYAFDREGKFITHIGRRGRGPGEYTWVDALSVDEVNERVYLNASSGVLEYTWDGKFLRTIPRQTFNEGTRYVSSASALTFIGDGLFLGHIDNNRGDEPHNWLLFDDRGTIVKAFDNHIVLDKTDFSSTDFDAMNPVFEGGDTYVKEYINDTLYVLNRQHELRPAYVFDTGEYSFPLNEHLTFDFTNPQPGPRERSIMIARNVVPLVVTPDAIFFTAGIGGKIRSRFDLPVGRAVSFSTALPPPGWTTAVQADRIITDDSLVAGIYDIATGETVFLDRDPVSRMYGMVNDLDGGVSFWPRYRTSAGELVQVLSAYDMKEALTENYFAAHPARDPAAHARLRTLVDSLSYEDNPVIVVANLKK